MNIKVFWNLIISWFENDNLCFSYIMNNKFQVSIDVFIKFL